MLGLLLISLSLGLSNFAAAIGLGLGGVSARTRLQTGLAFGLFEAAMPIPGLLIGQGLRGRLAENGQVLGAVLLVAAGAYVIGKGRLGDAHARGRTKGGQLGFGHLLVTGFALSLDNLAVGLALSFAQVPILLAAGLIAAVSVAMTLVGLELGQRLGARVEAWSAELGGAVLILVGLALGVGLL